MGQVVFSAKQQGAVFCAVKTYDLAVLTLLSTGSWCGRHPGVTCASPCRPGQFPRKPGQKYPLEPTFGVAGRCVTHCFIEVKYRVRNAVTTGLSRWRYALVTPPVHACNAKKIFARDIVEGVRLCSCNVSRAGRLASKFPENPVVRTAVNHLFDRIVYRRSSKTSLGPFSLANPFTLVSTFAPRATQSSRTAGGVQ